MVVEQMESSRKENGGIGYKVGVMLYKIKYYE